MQIHNERDGHSLINLCATSEAPEDATQGVYRLSHAIYSVVSPRQTLRELARDHESQLKLNLAHPLVVRRMRLLTGVRHVTMRRWFALQCFSFHQR